MKLILWIFSFVICSLPFLFTSCEKQQPEQKELSRSNRIAKSISPQIVDIVGIKFFQTSKDLKTRFPYLRCEKKSDELQRCSLQTTAEEREGDFHGIDQLQLTFYQDTLHNIKIQYSQMFELEYNDFEAGVRGKYAYRYENNSIDSSGNLWQYDSLSVTVVPNRKQHWTASVFLYTPVIEFQERTIYSRWLDALDRRKTKTVY